MMQWDKQKLKSNIEYCIERIDNGIEQFGDTFFPLDASVSGRYDCFYNRSWIPGFWTGLLMLAYEFTQKEKYLDIVKKHLDSYEVRIKNHSDVRHHDIGFCYSPSCVALYKLTGDERAKEVALAAADVECERYMERGGYIKAWGSMDDPKENRIIIDCLLNLPLLFWATEVSGNIKYREVALSHLRWSTELLIRPDFTTYHTYMMDFTEGVPIMPKTAQGYADDSIWARGQAWAVCGLAIAYAYIHDESVAEKQIACTNKFIDLLPPDSVPAWDMVFTDHKTMKDTSASAIAVCGMLEMNRLLGNHKDRDRWEQKIADMMNVLADNHLAGHDPDKSAILKHGTGSVPHGQGINASLIWGDYYYMEALMRMYNPDWVQYW